VTFSKLSTNQQAITTLQGAAEEVSKALNINFEGLSKMSRFMQNSGRDQEGAMDLIKAQELIEEIERKIKEPPMEQRTLVQREAITLFKKAAEAVTNTSTPSDAEPSTTTKGL
jgi:hypothetical protein